MIIFTMKTKKRTMDLNNITIWTIIKLIIKFYAAIFLIGLIFAIITEII